MQCDSGLLGWLKVPFSVNAFQAAIGGNALRRRLIRDHVRAKPGDKVIDIGCVQAQALTMASEVSYLGLIRMRPDIAFSTADIWQPGHFIIGATQSVRQTRTVKLQIL